MSDFASPIDQSSPASVVDNLVHRFRDHVLHTQGKDWEGVTLHDQFVALSLAVRDLLFERKLATQATHRQQDVKRVYYLSLEYLLGRQLRNNLVNLGLYELTRQRLADLKIDLAVLCDIEPDPGLGNGGLGRLAACYMDSLSTLQYPALGYGIRYEFGIFEQHIENGWQIERPEYWLRFGSPWEIARPELANQVRIGGRVEDRLDSRGRYRPTWVDYGNLIGMPYDLPMVGYGSNTTNLLRLWSAKAPESFDLIAFNRGGYVEAVRAQALAETISKVLYPSDELEVGRELRLTQQYFFVACTLGDILRRYDRSHDKVDALPDKIAIQLNDTHPALAIAEFMRILVDERSVEWERAWELTQGVFGYTNHTLLPEALEIWPIAMFNRLLPRHLQVIYEINRRFLESVEKRWPGDTLRKRRMSLVQEEPVRAVRMANLAIVGSHSVNGVAALHTELIRSRLVPEFAEMWPEKFNNKTNGVTPRRWLIMSNPGLAELITSRIGDGWTRDLDQLRRLEPLAPDRDFALQFRTIKQQNKQRLADWIQRRSGVRVDPQALFDVQVKRLHEYKRQLLNLLQVVIRYQRILDDPQADIVPRVVLFGAKAAPAYSRAKLIIKLINDVARRVNNDARVGDKLKLLFLPNYRVSLAELVIPAADLSEQISTAGMEASGTGNMKFAMNGALTIGTLDGANIEIREKVGADNFFLFGLTAEEVAERKPRHDPWKTYYHNAAVRRALDAIASGEFNREPPDLFHPITDSLTFQGDPYMLMADIESYLAAQDRVDALWIKADEWARAAILNVARIGYFSSDRSIREYAEQIWKITPIPVSLPGATRATGRIEQGTAVAKPPPAPEQGTAKAIAPAKSAQPGAAVSPARDKKATSIGEAPKSAAAKKSKPKP